LFSHRSQVFHVCFAQRSAPLSRTLRGIAGRGSHEGLQRLSSTSRCNRDDSLVPDVQGGRSRSGEEEVPFRRKRVRGWTCAFRLAASRDRVANGRYGGCPLSSYLGQENHSGRAFRYRARQSYVMRIVARKLRGRKCRTGRRKGVRFWQDSRMDKLSAHDEKHKCSQENNRKFITPFHVDRYYRHQALRATCSRCRPCSTVQRYFYRWRDRVVGLIHDARTVVRMP